MELTMCRVKNMRNDYEFDVDYVDPLTGENVIVTAMLYDDGVWEEYKEGHHYFMEILEDPIFHRYTYEDPNTGEILDMPLDWQEQVDEILKNIYWDRMQWFS